MIFALFYFQTYLYAEETKIVNLGNNTYYNNSIFPNIFQLAAYFYSLYYVNQLNVKKCFS